MKNITNNSMRYRSIYIKRNIFTASFILLIFFIFSIPTIASDADTIVYVTDTGNKYHVAGCGYLSRSCNETTLSEAVKAGKTPCSRCNPPILNEDYNTNASPDSKEDSSNDTTKKYYAGAKSNKWDPDSDRTVYLEDEIFHLKDCPKIQGDGMLRSLCFLTKEVQPCDFCQPLKYTSIKDVPGYVEPKEDNNFADLFVYSIFPCIITAVISFKIGRTNDSSKKLEQINGRFYDRFHHINNPKTGKPIVDAESYLEALKAQEEINKSK